MLESDGLRLRPVGPGDVDRIVEACTDPRTEHWLGQLPSPYTTEDAETYVESRTEQLATGTHHPRTPCQIDEFLELGAWRLGWIDADDRTGAGAAQGAGCHAHTVTPARFAQVTPARHPCNRIRAASGA